MQDPLIRGSGNDGNELYTHGLPKFREIHGTDEAGRPWRAAITRRIRVIDGSGTSCRVYVGLFLNGRWWIDFIAIRKHDADKDMSEEMFRAFVNIVHQHILKAFVYANGLEVHAN